ncbi:MAG: peptide chain release factor-like protein [Deltaproteobacteria bacterium]|nr:peptide chain release factor-like protein [Deltaproteobacteria bacterium]MBI4373295.1 peptide chain release factor-like protein [Deltaproteobacteria bacterium]
MARLGIREEEIEEHFVRGSGAGGQKINKTSSTVLVFHRPTRIQVRCQESRSQADNRFLARRLLVEKIEALLLGKQSEERKKTEKIRRQKRKRSRRAKEKMLKEKHHRSKVLAQRKIEFYG